MIKYKRKDIVDPVSINMKDANLPKEQLIEKRSKIVSPDYLDYLYSQEGIRKQYEQSKKDVEMIRNKIVEEGLNAVANKEDFEDVSNSKHPWYADYEKNHPGEAKTCIGALCDIANRAIKNVNPKWRFPIQTSNIQFNQSLKEGKLPYEEIPLIDVNKGDIIQHYKNNIPYHSILAIGKPKTELSIVSDEDLFYDHNLKPELKTNIYSIADGHPGQITKNHRIIKEQDKAYRFVGDIPKLKKELESNQSITFKGKKYL